MGRRPAGSVSAARSDDEAEQHGSLPQGAGGTGASVLAERKEKKRQKQIEKNLRQGQLAHEKAVKRRAEREAAEAKKAAAEKDTNPCQAEMT